MVYRKSEYQKQYKTSVFVKNLPNYVDNITFRLARKRDQYAHTPLAWEDSECTSSSGSETDMFDCPQPASFKKAIVESSAQVPFDSGEADDKAVHTCDSELKSTVKTEALENKKQHSVPKKTEAGARHKQQSRHTDKRQLKTCCARPAAASQKQPDIPCPSPCRPPFISYGWADKRESVAVHKTHNVLSSQDVYPSALKALQRMKETKKFLIGRQNRDKNSKQKFSKSFTWTCTNQPTFWETEYQRNFTHPQSV